MKNLHMIIALFAVVLFSCGNKQQEPSYNDASYAQNYYQGNNNYNDVQEATFVNSNFNQSQSLQNTNTNYQQSNKKPMDTNGSKKTFVIKDPSNGMTYGTMPIPQSWKPTPNDKETYIQGPNGIKVFKDASNFFMYSNDPGFNQFMQQQGNQVRPVMQMEDFFNKDIKPLAEKEGSRLVNKYPLKQMADIDSRIDMMFVKTMQENKMISAMVTEWEDNKGNKSILLIKHNVTNYGNGSQSWGFTLSGMEAPSAIYNQAKNDFMIALLNVRINPQYVQAINQKTQQQAKQKNAGHQARMASIKAFGENNTRNFNARSAANDARHNSWQAGQAASDNSHRQFINGINETSTMTDNNGNYYQVQGYSNNTWVNGNNQAIQTDDYNYNPNGDINTNGTDWRQLNETDNGDW